MPGTPRPVTTTTRSARLSSPSSPADVEV
jgi:hypothetical protein